MGSFSFIGRLAAILATVVAAVILPAAAQAAAPVPCEQLAKLALPQAMITLVQSVGAEQYQPPMGPGLSGRDITGRTQHKAKPAFCRIAATLKPAKGSSIRIEVWLPAAEWNGKFLGVGNFGWGGELLYSAMMAGVQDGYATASTDTGHDSKTDGEGGRFSLGQPDKLIDYAYRADHEMTVKAKAIIKAFYGVGPKRSYWIGCSLGGLEGLIEAKRYPADYDGIVVGAPPNPLVRFNALQLHPGWLIAQDPARLIPKDKYAMVHAAVLKACASPIGQQDGVVDEPDRCGFLPRQLLCAGADAPDCLTASQVDLLERTYEGVKNPRTGELIYPGPAKGSELEMFTFASGQPFTNALDLYRYMAFQDPDFDWKAMDWDRDVAKAEAKLGPLLHVDSHLKPFFDRGGKLLLFIGWNDYHNPHQLIAYYQAVVRDSTTAKTRDAIRLFAIPGMNHCRGGEGCDTFNKLGVMDAWVDQSQVPERIEAKKVEGPKVVRTRPLCAWPKVARYDGQGDVNDAASFACAATAR